MADRRNFLKLFGVTAAALPVMGTAGTTIERIEEKQVSPLVPYSPSAWDERQYMDIQSAQLYSAMNFTEGATHHSFFRDAIGVQAQWKQGEAVTLDDTNMCMCSRLPAPEVFLVQKMGLVFSPSGVEWDSGMQGAARSAFIESASISLWLGQKVFQRFPVASIFSVGGRRNAGRINPEFPIAGMGTLQLPVVIDNQMSFFVEVQHAYSLGKFPYRDDRPPRIRAWAVLEGLHARGVC